MIDIFTRRKQISRNVCRSNYRGTLYKARQLISDLKKTINSIEQIT